MSQEEELPNIVRKILHENSQISLRSLNLENEDSVRNLLWEADHAIQYGENLEPDDKTFEQAQKYLNQ